MRLVHNCFSPDRPVALVKRTKEYLEIKRHLLDSVRGDPVVVVLQLLGGWCSFVRLGAYWLGTSVHVQGASLMTTDSFQIR